MAGAAKLAAARTLEQVAAGGAETAAVIGATAMWLGWLDADTGWSTIVGASGDGLVRRAPLAWTVPYMAEVFATGKMLHSAQLAFGPVAEPLRHTLGELGLAEASIVPAHGGGDALGVIVFGFAESCSTDTLDDDQLQLLADMVGGAWGRVIADEHSQRLAHAERLARGRLERLQQLSAELGRAVSLTEVAEVASRAGADAVWAGYAMFALLTEDGTLRLTHGPGIDPAVARKWPEIPLDNDVPIAEACRTGVPVLTPDTAAALAHFPERADAAREAGAAATAAVPLIAGGRILGAIGFSWPTPVTFDLELLEQLGAVASLSAQAFERATAYERQQRIAEILQRSLMPESLPTIAGLDIEAVYRPAERSDSIGGDWFDAISVTDTLLAVVIGDVSGHGIEAAATMGRLVHSTRAYLHDVHEPVELAARLSRLLKPRARLATMCCVLLDVESGEMTWVSAGHPPLLVLRPDGSHHYLEAGRRTPLGVPQATPVEPGRATLERGETLLLYTDGIYERRGEHPDDGLRRLGEIAAQFERLPTATRRLEEDLVDALTDDAAAGPDSAAADDVAVFRLHRRA